MMAEWARNQLANRRLQVFATAFVRGVLTINCIPRVPFLVTNAALLGLDPRAVPVRYATTMAIDGIGLGGLSFEFKIAFYTCLSFGFTGVEFCRSAVAA